MPLSAAGMGIVRHCPASPISVPKRALDGTFQSPDIIINFGYMKYWEIRLSLTHHDRICILTCPETVGFSPETSRSYVPHSNFNFQYRPVFVPIDLNVTIKVIKRNHLINQMNLFFSMNLQNLKEFFWRWVNKRKFPSGNLSVDRLVFR